MRMTAPQGFFYEDEWCNLFYGSYRAFIEYTDSLEEDKRLALIAQHHANEWIAF